MSQTVYTEETVAPPTPASGRWKLYFKSTGLFIIDDAGTESGPFGISGIADGDYGSVTVSGGGTVITIDAGAVTLAMLVDATAQYRIMARSSSGAGDWQELPSSADVFAILGAANNAGIKTLLTLVKGDVGLGNVDNTSDGDKPVSTAQQAAIDAAVVGLLDPKGPIDASANPNYPAALKGDAYVISVAGKVGGASGTSVEVGDFIFATADNAGGTEASVGTSWAKIEHNIIGALIAANNLSDVASKIASWDNLTPQSSDIASASTTDLATATGVNVNVTGTTTITALGTLAAGIFRIVKFTGALTLTHNGTSLILPNGSNIVTENGDTAVFVSLGSGNWKCLFFQQVYRHLRPVTVTQSATPSINVDAGDLFVITGLAQAITSLTTNLTGTPRQGQMMMHEITDDGTGRAITPGASFVGTSNNTLSGLTTTATKKLILLWKYSTALTKWELLYKDISL